MIEIRIMFHLQKVKDRGRAEVPGDEKDNPAVNKQTRKESIPGDSESCDNVKMLELQGWWIQE